jgi:hypothetical protein
MTDTIRAAVATTPAAVGTDRDGPVSVALALLDRHWPLTPPLADIVGFTTARADDVAELEKDTRYLLGRFQQAVAALLATDLPSMDSLTSLLSAAIADAISWRQHEQRPCQRCAYSLCASCSTDSEQADRYHALARALGAVADPGRPSRLP